MHIDVYIASFSHDGFKKLLLFLHVGAPQSATTEGDAKNGLSGITIAMIIIIVVLVIILIIVSICYQNSYRKWKSNYHKLDDDNKL